MVATGRACFCPVNGVAVVAGSRAAGAGVCKRTTPRARAHAPARMCAPPAPPTRTSSSCIPAPETIGNASAGEPTPAEPATEPHKPAPAALTSTQTRFLRSEAGRRAAAGTLATVSASPTPSPAAAAATAAAIEAALAEHELVRVRAAVRKRREAGALGKALAEATGAQVAQVLGHTALLYRARAGGLPLPAAAAAAKVEE